MKSILKSVFVCVCIIALASLLPAQTVTPAIAGGNSNFPRFNPPPCDFSDQFYADTGLDSATGAELNAEPDGRFGSFRQFGPPSTSSNQANWVADSNCATNDPTRRNFRILATTGATKDDTGAPTEFFSIIAFIHNLNAFTGAPGAVTQSHVRTVGAIGPNGGLDNQQTNPGENISITPGTDVALGATAGLNPRGISMNFIVNNFEAYGATKQSRAVPAQFGTLAPTPCGSLFGSGTPNQNNPAIPGEVAINSNDCFSLSDGKNPDGSTLSDAATPNLRQDWRVASNRNAIDGSDNNCISTDPTVCASVHDSPFGYFCDDLLGMWIVTYFWYTQNSLGGTDANNNHISPTMNCNHVLSCISQQFGNNLDGTPIIKTGNQLHFIEGVPNTTANVFPGQGVPGACLQDSDLPTAAPCGAEGNIDAGGGDNGAVWLVCPVLQDPRNGAIATDAFLDVVRRSNGNAQNTDLLNNFSCLQKSGKFCNEAAPGQ